MKRILAAVTGIVLLGLLPLSAGAATLAEAGKSAVLMDVTTGTVLYEHNSHEALAPASVTKVMTMLLIMEAADSGKIALTDTVTASEAAAAKGGSQIYLKAGETMSVSDMLKSIAVSSANDCACAMAEHICGSESAFVEAMNRRAKELGMQDTHFVNCTGLDDDDSAKLHRTSAYDIALMSRELLKNHPGIQKYTTIWMDTVRNGAFGLSNTNKLIRFYRPKGGHGADCRGHGGENQPGSECRLQGAAGLWLCQFRGGSSGTGGTAPGGRPAGKADPGSGSDGGNRRDAH